MIQSSDIGTVKALRELLDELPRSEKPVVVWVGAGASSWCGYKRWEDMAQYFHDTYRRYEAGYDAHKGAFLLSKQDFPGLFDLCKCTSLSRYAKMLTDELSIRPVTPLFKRFCSAISRVTPIHVLTTNVDEMLEKHIEASLIEHDDLARARSCLLSKQPFICKLHGSISNIKSVVFSTADYHVLENDESYLSQLAGLIAMSHLIFIGYGLRDEYLVKLLQKNIKDAKAFGDGPHYAILTTEGDAFPESVKVIKYVGGLHTDHRDSIQVLEQYGISQASKVKTDIQPSIHAFRSSHLLFHIFPPGTYISSQRLGFATDENGRTMEALVGSGFTNEELPDNRSTAFHDLIVGLLCFDQTYAPINAAGRVHDLLGAELFWRLVSEDILSFIQWENQECVIFPSTTSLSGGDLASIKAFNPDQTEKSVEQIIRQQLSAVPGHEVEAARLFKLLFDKTKTIPVDIDNVVPQYTRSLLLRPEIRRLLGVSEGNPISSLTRWNVFPIIRLATVVKIGIACSYLGIASTKLDFGAAMLAGPALATVAGREWVDDVAGYVLCGRFAADLGSLAMADPSIIEAVLRFRETAQGVSMRSEIFSHLSRSEAADAFIAVNAALHESISTKILQSARDKFIEFRTPNIGDNKVRSPSLWNDQRYSELAISKWRARSRQILFEHINALKLDLYSECPCGSGDKLKFCCEAALK